MKGGNQENKCRKGPFGSRVASKGRVIGANLGEGSRGRMGERTHGTSGASKEGAGRTGRSQGGVAPIHFDGLPKSLKKGLLQRRGSEKGTALRIDTTLGEALRISGYTELMLVIRVALSLLEEKGGEQAGKNNLERGGAYRYFSALSGLRSLPGRKKNRREQLDWSF